MDTVMTDLSFFSVDVPSHLFFLPPLLSPLLLPSFLSPSLLPLEKYHISYLMIISLPYLGFLLNLAWYFLAYQKLNTVGLPLFTD